MFAGCCRRSLRYSAAHHHVSSCALDGRIVRHHSMKTLEIAKGPLIKLHFLSPRRRHNLNPALRYNGQPIQVRLDHRSHLFHPYLWIGNPVLEASSPPHCLSKLPRRNQHHEGNSHHTEADSTLPYPTRKSANTVFAFVFASAFTFAVAQVRACAYSPLSPPLSLHPPSYQKNKCTAPPRPHVCLNKRML